MADDSHSPKAPKSSRSDPEIWRKPALRKIAAATRANTAAVARFLRQRRYCAQPWSGWLPFVTRSGKSGTVRGRGAATSQRLTGKVMIVQGKSLRPMFAMASIAAARCLAPAR